MQNSTFWHNSHLRCHCSDGALDNLDWCINCRCWEFSVRAPAICRFEVGVLAVSFFSGASNYRFVDHGAAGNSRLLPILIGEPVAIIARAKNLGYIFCFKHSTNRIRPIHSGPCVESSSEGSNCRCTSLAAKALTIAANQT